MLLCPAFDQQTSVNVTEDTDLCPGQDLECQALLDNGTRDATSETNGADWWLTKFRNTPNTGKLLGASVSAILKIYINMYSY